jgi:hypothetical protein
VEDQTQQRNEALLLPTVALIKHMNGRLKLTATQRYMKTRITYQMTTIQMTLAMTPTCIRNVRRMISSHCAVKLLYPTVVVESVAWVHSIYVFEILYLNTK